MLSGGSPPAYSDPGVPPTRFTPPSPLFPDVAVSEPDLVRMMATIRPRVRLPHATGPSKGYPGPVEPGFVDTP